MPIDMGSVAALATSLQSAVEIAKALVGLREAAAIRDKAIELQSVIMSAQANALTAQREQFVLSDRVRELEEQIAEMQEWEEEKQRYGLKQISNGAFAYAVKMGMLEGEPEHWLCQRCFEDGKKSVLQEHGRSDKANGWKYECPRCSAYIIVNFWPPQANSDRCGIRLEEGRLATARVAP
jgi:Zn finger protein HypA/HybF involved in hydrogenase expression